MNVRQPRFMKRILTLFITGILLITTVGVALWGSAGEACAVPAFARQMNVSCDQCHTVWPRLNSFGRRFKVKGYVDRAENPGFPLAARVIITAESARATTAGESTTEKTINFPDAVNVFVGTAFSPQVGTFIEASVEKEPTSDGTGTQFSTSLDTAKLAFRFDQKMAASVVLFKGNLFAAEPYESLNVDRSALSGDFGVPGFMDEGFLVSPLDETNYGVAVHGFLGADQRIYGSLAVQTGGVPGEAGEELGLVRTPENEGPNYMGRVAYEGSLPKGGAWHVGAAYFTATPRPRLTLPDGSALRFRTKATRIFVDGGVQLPMQDNDIFELIGLYSLGRDRDLLTVDPETGELSEPFGADVKGFFAQADYFFLNRRVGVLALYDHTTVTPVTTNRWGLGISWLPFNDFKVTLQGGPSSNSLGDTTSTIQLDIRKYF